MASYQQDQQLGANFESALHKTINNLGWNKIQQATFFKGLALWGRGVPDIEQPAYMIEWVATKPQYQRKGIVDQLLNYKLEQGKGAGFGSAHLFMQINNKAAQSAYEIKGFRITSEQRAAEFEKGVGNPGLVVMSTEL